MKILIGPCPICSRSGGSEERFYRAVRDDNIYYLTCKNGHKILYTEQIFRFNQLFEIACNAIIDGYYREAVLSFSASLERFYQTCVETIMYLRQPQDKEFEAVWKSMKNSSERQYGAFQVLYLHHSGVAPISIDERKIPAAKQTFKAFRNAVAHQGYIPIEEQALEFGTEVAVFVKPIMKEMRKLYMPNGGPGKSENVFSIIKIREVHSTFAAANKKHPVYDASSTGGSQSVLDEAVFLEEGENNLAALIEKRRQWRRH